MTRVPPDPHLRFDTCDYSLDPVFVGRRVEARVTDREVLAIVLDTGKNYPNPAEAGEAHGVRFVSLLKISTDEGITGWSDIETQPHVGKAIVDAPSGGAVGFEGLRRTLEWSRAGSV